MTSRYFTTKGLILKKQPSGENDWFLTIFSPEYGKIQAVSRSARKISSIKGSHFDPLNLCDFQFYKNGDRLMITECRVENAHIPIKSDLQKSVAAFTIMELLLRSIQEDNQNIELFALTLETLARLNLGTNDLHLEEYKIKLLKDNGSWPDLSRCHYCQIIWKPESLIGCDRNGHLTCEGCVPLATSILDKIPFNIVKLAKFLCDQGPDKLKIVITPQELFQLKKLVNLFLHNYLQLELKSDKVFL